LLIGSNNPLFASLGPKLTVPIWSHKGRSGRQTGWSS